MEEPMMDFVEQQMRQSANYTIFSMVATFIIIAIVVFLIYKFSEKRQNNSKSRYSSYSESNYEPNFEEKKGLGIVKARRNAFGDVEYLDQHGNTVAKRKTNVFGEGNYTDSNYTDLGRSSRDFSGRTEYKDNNGNRVGYSETDFFGDTIYYDNNGNKVAKGKKDFFGDEHFTDY